MKRIILAALVIFGAASVQAQSNIHAQASTVKTVAVEDEEETDPEPAKPAAKALITAETIENASMTMEEGKIVFEHLPVSNDITLHITDEQGREVITKRVNGKRNSVDISRLRKGMHFVTLTSDSNGNRKTFTLANE